MFCSRENRFKDERWLAPIYSLQRGCGPKHFWGFLPTLLPPLLAVAPQSSMIASRLASSVATQMTTIQRWTVTGGCLMHKEPLEVMRGGMSQQVIKHSASPGSHVCFLCLSPRGEKFNFQYPNVVSYYLEGRVTLSKFSELSEPWSPHLHPGGLYLSLLSRCVGWKYLK